MGGCSLIGDGITDPKTNNLWSVEFHGCDSFEIGFLRFSKGVLGSRDTGAADHIYKTFRNLINIADAFLRRLWRNQKHIVQTVFFKQRLIFILININRQVRNNQAVNSNTFTTCTKSLHSILKHGVEIPH